MGEEVIFGRAETTTGASSDLNQVTNRGMSDVGPWMTSDGQQGDMIMRMMQRNAQSEALQAQIDAAVKKISDDAYQVALAQMRENREAIDEVVELLIERETISGDEFRDILSKYTKIPEENLKAATASIV